MTLKRTRKINIIRRRCCGRRSELGMKAVVKLLVGRDDVEVDWKKIALVAYAVVVGGGEGARVVVKLLADRGRR